MLSFYTALTFSIHLEPYTLSHFNICKYLGVLKNYFYVYIITVK
jgi:hypothetical protein